MERAPDDEADKEEEQKTPEKKEEKEETTTEASPAKQEVSSLMQRLGKPKEDKKEVVHDFNCFNRTWTKRHESIYFYKIKNNYQKED